MCIRMLRIPCMPGKLAFAAQMESAAAQPPLVNPAALDTLYSNMQKEQHHDLKGIVIVRNGTLVSEHYFNGDSSTTLHDIRSATKSVTSLLMGIAIDKKIVHGVHDPIALYLPGLPTDGKEKIKIEDLLTVRSGLDADDVLLHQRLPHRSGPRECQ